MSILKHERDIADIRDSGEIIKKVFLFIEKAIKAGMSTAELDRIVEDFIIENGGTPAFKGYKGYPATICASPNNVVVHGIPSEDVLLNNGDIISIDVGVKKNGFYTDAARTFPVGEISEEALRLVEVTRECLAEGIRNALPGNRVSDISVVIEEIARDNGYEEVRIFVGHGIGKQLHEAPEIPNWGRKGTGPVLKEGHVLAIEPMINVGKREVKILSDGWTAVTADNKLSAHFEDTVILGGDGTEILT